MYAKVLFHRNNKGRPSVICDTRDGVFRKPAPPPPIRRVNRVRQVPYRTIRVPLKVLLLAGKYPGPFLRMSCLKSSSNDMLCELCNQKAAITCPRCRVAHYCCVEHRKSDSKLHRKKCVGFSTTAQETQFTDTSYRHRFYESMNLYPTAKYVVETLNRQGYCYLDGFHGEDISLKILGEVKELHRKEKFTDGQLVSSNGNGSVSNKKIRDDKITWVDGKEENCGTISHHMARVNALIRECNELIEDHEIEHRTKAMVACYPGQGTGYKKHVDNPNQDGRCITTLYYLNPGWTEEKGGLLKLFPKAKEREEVKILPKLDRLLLFWSDHRNPHEVEPSHDVRYAITLWYFDKNERAEFRKKQEEEQRRCRVNSNQQVGSNQEEKESDSDN